MKIIIKCSQFIEYVQHQALYQIQQQIYKFFFFSHNFKLKTEVIIMLRELSKFKKGNLTSHVPEDFFMLRRICFFAWDKKTDMLILKVIIKNLDNCFCECWGKGIRVIGKKCVPVCMCVYVSVQVSERGLYNENQE